ncbi:MAG: AraC family transcriptional regulator [Clostridia bacterium]|nr:AraC family transcriptional regulator [Clostridia bacterium]
MFYLSNHTQVITDEFIKKGYTGFASDSGIALSHYKSLFPYRLMISTLHPDDSKSGFITTTVTPEDVTYSIIGLDELSTHISGKLHQHDFYELMFVLKGEIYQNIEYNRHLYTTGSCCLLNRSVRHTEEFNTDFTVAFLQISPDFFKSFFDDMSLHFFEIEKQHQPSDLENFLSINTSESLDSSKDYLDFIPASENQIADETIHDIFDNITFETLYPTIRSSHTIKCLLIKLLYYLSESVHFTTTPVRIGNDNENNLFHDITEYMKQAHGHITRSELEKLLHYSGAYLNEITKKYTGLSIFDYGMNFCMKEAAELLTHSSKNVADIAMLLGFTNKTHFYKIFQKTFDMTPTAYRKHHIPI